MVNKCFLYIDGYPRNASDVPFDISIDWGDGSEPEQYFRLFVEKVPQFYHLYEDTEPRTITVTITNRCGSSVQTIEYIPFVPPECECQNFYNLNLGNIAVDFTGVEWNLEITGCFTDVVQTDTGHVMATMVTDVSTNLSLVAFPKILSLLPDQTFSLTTPVIPKDDTVENLATHVGNTIEEGGGDGSGDEGDDGDDGSGSGSGSGGSGSGGGGSGGGGSGGGGSGGGGSGSGGGGSGDSGSG